MAMAVACGSDREGWRISGMHYQALKGAQRSDVSQHLGLKRTVLRLLEGVRKIGPRARPLPMRVVDGVVGHLLLVLCPIDQLLHLLHGEARNGRVER